MKKFYISFTCNILDLLVPIKRIKYPEARHSMSHIPGTGLEQLVLTRAGTVAISGGISAEGLDLGSIMIDFLLQKATLIPHHMLNI